MLYCSPFRVGNVLGLKNVEMHLVLTQLLFEALRPGDVVTIETVLAESFGSLRDTL